MSQYRMTPQEWLQFQSQLLDNIKELTRAKNQDYTAGSGDPFANFREAEDFGVPTLTGLSVRMGDKFQRIKSYLKNGELAVANEGIEDAFKDLIGYSCLALGLIEEQRRSTFKDYCTADKCEPGSLPTGPEMTAFEVRQREEELRRQFANKMVDEMTWTAQESGEYDDPANHFGGNK